MTAVRRYEASMYDSSRWDGFELRAGDIIISTPPKCGTTWTQMICALVVLQEAELPLPLDTLSPWLDMMTRPRSEVFADLGAQTWETVRPAGRSTAKDLPSRRLFYWSMRFFPHDSARYFAECTRAMEAAFYPGLPLTSTGN